MSIGIERERIVKTELDYAQEMADWFPDFLYGVADEPRALPDLSVQRLQRQFGEGDPATQITVIRDSLMAFPDEHQSNLALYFCGYPDDALDVLADSTSPLIRSIEELDRRFTPPQPLKAEIAVVEYSEQPSAPKVVPKETRKQLAARALAEQTTARHRRMLNSEVAVAVTITPVEPEDDGPLAWQADALCAQTDPEAFFPEKGGSTRDAKKICVSCDVRDRCLEYALSQDERFGIWGGLSERERRKLKRRGQPRLGEGSRRSA
jgi:WhiB family redox-sensing transcriptional regulator